MRLPKHRNLGRLGHLLFHHRITDLGRVFRVEHARQVNVGDLLVGLEHFGESLKAFDANLFVVPETQVLQGGVFLESLGQGRNACVFDIVGGEVKHSQTAVDLETRRQLDGARIGHADAIQTKRLEGRRLANSGGNQVVMLRIETKVGNAEFFKLVICTEIGQGFSRKAGLGFLVRLEDNLFEATNGTKGAHEVVERHLFLVDGKVGQGKGMQLGMTMEGIFEVLDGFLISLEVNGTLKNRKIECQRDDRVDVLAASQYIPIPDSPSWRRRSRPGQEHWHGRGQT
jgi:hypothetical protein